MDNPKELYGTWPGEPDDGFEESIDDLRHSYLQNLLVEYICTAEEARTVNPMESEIKAAESRRKERNNEMFLS